MQAGLRPGEVSGHGWLLAATGNGLHVECNDTMLWCIRGQKTSTEHAWYSDTFLQAAFRGLCVSAERLSTCLVVAAQLAHVVPQLGEVQRGLVEAGNLQECGVLGTQY